MKTDLLMAIIKKIIKSTDEDIKTLIHCWLESRMGQLLWKTVWQFIKKLNSEILHDPKTHSRYVPKKTENIFPRKTSV